MSADVIQGWLDRFDAAVRAKGAGPFAYPRAFHHDGGGHGFHLVFGSLVHGDEVGSLPAVVAVAEALLAGTLRHAGKVTLFLGNPEAALAGQRFLEADMAAGKADQAGHVLVEETLALLRSLAR